MSNHTMEYMALKSKQEQEEKKKRQDSRDAENKLLMKRTTTTTNPIPDMTDAYSKGMNSGYTPTEAEIHYRRLTTGRVMDMAK